MQKKQPYAFDKDAAPALPRCATPRGARRAASAAPARRARPQLKRTYWLCKKLIEKLSNTRNKIEGALFFRFPEHQERHDVQAGEEAPASLRNNAKHYD